MARETPVKITLDKSQIGVACGGHVEWAGVVTGRGQVKGWSVRIPVKMSIALRVAAPILWTQFPGAVMEYVRVTQRITAA